MVVVPFDINDLKIRQTFLTEILPDCINNLDETMQPQWGKLTVQHMVEHLIWTFELSTGKFDIPFDMPPQQVRAARMFLRNNRAMPRDFKNPMLSDEPFSLLYADLDHAKTGFFESLTLFFNHFQTQPDVIHTHPVFGPVGKDDWQRIHFKHCYHHLLQFGLITESDTI